MGLPVVRYYHMNAGEPLRKRIHWRSSSEEQIKENFYESNDESVTREYYKQYPVNKNYKYK